MARLSRKRAIEAIDEHGALLVYPINNRPDPVSLWSCFFPRSAMRWDWTDGSGDSRVNELWLLREELSRSGEVVYAKWFRGRATFFSKPLFVALTHVLSSGRPEWEGLSAQARELLRALEESSPLSTKELKKAAGLVGRAHERAYEKGMKSLWQRLLVVGFGERDDGAFPSLMMGATRLLFEELWQESHAIAPEVALELVDALMPKGSLFRKHLDGVLRERTKLAEAKPKKLVGWAGVERLRD